MTSFGSVQCDSMDIHFDWKCIQVGLERVSFLLCMQQLELKRVQFVEESVLGTY